MTTRPVSDAVRSDSWSKPAPSAIVRARGVIRIFPGAGANVAALRGLDLDVATGEIVAIVGASGSGKTTLLRILAGLDHPSAGSVESLAVHLDRAPEGKLARYRERVGVIDQQYWRSLSPYLSARHSIELPLRLRGWPRQDRAHRSSQLLEAVGLGDRGEALPTELSGGEQQRVAFAAALAPQPSLILADEPTAELDERTATELVHLLRELVRREGTTAIVVTHDRLVEDMADRVVYLRDGRAIAIRRGAGAVERLVDESGWQAPHLPPAPPPLERLAPAPGMRPAVVLDKVTRAYGQGGRAIVALHELSATFASGGLHVVTGPSGSGKSTLLRLIAGLDRPTAGRVRTLDTNLDELDRGALAGFRSEHIAICPQAPRLIPFLSAAENVELGLAVRKQGDRHGRRERAIAALGVVGLAALAGASPGALSGGERMRVAIARALAATPSLLILDEPTAALDRASATALVSLLARLDRTDVTLVVATHDRDLIAATGDQLDLRDSRRELLGSRPLRGE